MQMADEIWVCLEALAFRAWLAGIQMRCRRPCAYAVIDGQVTTVKFLVEHMLHSIGVDMKKSGNLEFIKISAFLSSC